MDAVTLFDDAVAGDRRALARLLTVVEQGGEPFRAVSSAIFAAGQGSHSIGITGAPGAGKSSLTDALVAEIRHHDERVAVLAVDPSSPITGGAILGDRVRLRGEHAMDSGVYMRSLASRGQLGGLSLAVPASLRVLDAAGWGTVIVETVGVGQSEVAIAGAADTTLVVVNPGWGDEVQANKAGLLEIADILVVNKGDRPDVGSTVRDLERMIHLGKARPWNPIIVVTIATTGDGVAELHRTISDHKLFLAASGEGARRRAQRRVTEARERLAVDLHSAIETVESSAAGVDILAGLERGDLDPVSAGHRLLELAAEFTSRSA